jgi:hypothetical protein
LKLSVDDGTSQDFECLRMWSMEKDVEMDGNRKQSVRASFFLLPRSYVDH